MSKPCQCHIKATKPIIKDFDSELAKSLSSPAPPQVSAVTKPRLSLIPTNALWDVGIAYTMGREKRGGELSDEELLKGGSYKERADKIFRHLLQFLSGENADGENGQRHLTAIAANAMMLLDWQIRKVGTDDRK